MPRIFVNSKDIVDNKIIVSNKAQIHHLKNVLRLKAGENITVCDETGNEYNAEVKEMSGDNAILKVKKMNKAVLNKKMSLTIACAIPKKSKIEDIIDKLTQLGADKIIPLITERVIVKLDRDKAALRLTRWRKIALSAGEQSQRRILPVIDDLTELKTILASAEDYDLKLIPTLFGKRKTIKEIFSRVDFQPRNILVLIGPEGDFTDAEVDSAKKVGFIPITLGDLVLRVETAAVSVASFIRFRLL